MAPARKPTALGSRLRASAGLEVRVAMLDQDLILIPDKDGIAHIKQDNFCNTCDREGGPCSNHKP